MLRVAGQCTAYNAMRTDREAVTGLHYLHGNGTWCRDFLSGKLKLHQSERDMSSVSNYGKTSIIFYAKRDSRLSSRKHSALTNKLFSTIKIILRLSRCTRAASCFLATSSDLFKQGHNSRYRGCRNSENITFVLQCKHKLQL